MSLPPIFSKKSDVFTYESLLSNNLNLILLPRELPFILDYFLVVFCRTFSTVIYLDMIFRTKKKELKIFDEPGMRNIHQEISLIWWTSPLNVMILTWKLYHSFSIPVSTNSPNFSPFEVSWTEIESWRECLKCFSIFLSSWFFLASDEFFSFQANSIYLILFFCVCEIACRDWGHHRALFWIKLSFIGYKDVYVTRQRFLAHFLSHGAFVPFLHLKKWLT